MDNAFIISNAFVLTCDPLNRGGRLHLLIRNGRIAEITDKLPSLTNFNPHAEVIDATGKLILPCFVNAHIHSESLLVRELTDGTHYTLWKENDQLHRILKSLLDPANGADVRAITRFAYLSHLKSGTTTVGEFGLEFESENLAAMLAAIRETKVRSVVALQNWDQIRYAQKQPPDFHSTIVNLGREEDFTLYSFESSNRAARELNTRLVAHVCEQRDDAECIKKNFQKGIVAVLRQFDLLRESTTLVHLNHVSPEEVQTLKEVEATVVVCTRSTSYKQTGYPSLRPLLEQNVRLAIGTDWGDVDMLYDMRFLYHLPLLLAGFPPPTAMDVVRMATINGAHALGLSAEVGSIEQGKQADLSFFDLSDLRIPRVRESANAETLAMMVVKRLSSRDISDVMARGEFLVKDRIATWLPESDIIADYYNLKERFFSANGKSANGSGNGDLSQGAPAKPKVIPFVPNEKAQEVESENFEAGFTPRPKSATIVDINDRGVTPNDRPLKPAETERPIVKPELPKTTRRTFGEDEDY